MQCKQSIEDAVIIMDVMSDILAQGNALYGKRCPYTHTHSFFVELVEVLYPTDLNRFCFRPFNLWATISGSFWKLLKSEQLP